MIYLDKNTELTTDLLHKIINRFVMNVQPKLQRWENYYNGKHDILNKSYSDTTKVCNHIVTNYCKIIADTYKGYIVGKPVSYTSNQNIDDVQGVINYNDSNSEDINICEDALVYGVAYELFWIDEYAQIRYSRVNPLNSFAIYDNSLDSKLLYFVRWYKADSFDDSDLVYITVYDKSTVKVFKAHSINGALEFV